MKLTAGEVIPDLIGRLVVGYLVPMRRPSATRTYWYATAAQAHRAAARFQRTRRWPRKKNVRNTLRRSS